MISATGMSETLRLTGHPTWTFLEWKDTLGFTANEIKTLFMQIIFEKGLLLLGSHNVTLAHSEKIQNRVLEIYSETFAEIRSALVSSSLNEKLLVRPLLPLFRVR
jgi:glutamate-1-semialdehyde 2,1-aminomutase